MNRPAMCCARLDDFDWAVPDYDPDILLSGRDMEVRVTDVTQDIQDVFPAIFDETAAVPMSLPVVGDTGPQVGPQVDVLLSGRDMGVGVTDITQDMHVLPDIFPAIFDKTAHRHIPNPNNLPLVPRTRHNRQVHIRQNFLRINRGTTVIINTIGAGETSPGPATSSDSSEDKASKFMHADGDLIRPVKQTGYGDAGESVVAIHERSSRTGLSPESVNI